MLFTQYISVYYISVHRGSFCDVKLPHRIYHSCSFELCKLIWYNLSKFGQKMNKFTDAIPYI